MTCSEPNYCSRNRVADSTPRARYRNAENRYARKRYRALAKSGRTTDSEAIERLLAG